MGTSGLSITRPAVRRGTLAAMNLRLLLRAGLAAALLTSALTAAAADRVPAHPSVSALPLTRVKVMPTGAVIATLTADTIIAGQPCAKGWLHLHPNGRPEGFTASAPIDHPRMRIPAGTWVVLTPEGVIRLCAFPEDIDLQGHRCRGTGGPKGVQVAFHPDGAIRQFYLTQPTRIDGVPCDDGLIRGAVFLHPNGRLQSCRLSEPFERDGRRYERGTRLTFDDTGRLPAP